MEVRYRKWPSRNGTPRWMYTLEWPETITKQTYLDVWLSAELELNWWHTSKLTKPYFNNHTACDQNMATSSWKCILHILIKLNICFMYVVLIILHLSPSTTIDSTYNSLWDCCNSVFAGSPGIRSAGYLDLTQGIVGTAQTFLQDMQTSIVRNIIDKLLYYGSQQVVLEICMEGCGPFSQTQFGLWFMRTTYIWEVCAGRSIFMG